MEGRSVVRRGGPAFVLWEWRAVDGAALRNAGNDAHPSNVEVVASQVQINACRGKRAVEGVPQAGQRCSFSEWNAQHRRATADARHRPMRRIQCLSKIPEDQRVVGNRVTTRLPISEEKRRCPVSGVAAPTTTLHTRRASKFARHLEMPRPLPSVGKHRCPATDDAAPFTFLRFRWASVVARFRATLRPSHPESCSFASGTLHPQPSSTNRASIIARHQATQHPPPPSKRGGPVLLPGIGQRHSGNLPPPSPPGRHCSCKTSSDPMSSTLGVYFALVRYCAPSTLGDERRYPASGDLAGFTPFT